MDLYAITLPDCFPGEAQWLLELLRCGITGLHLRKPTLGSEAQLLDLLHPLLEAGYADRIVLHSFFHSARDYGIHRLHLKESMHHQELYRSLMDYSLSVSLHQWSDALAVRDGLYQYAFISPVFPSISKPGYTNDRILDQAEAHLRSVSMPMVALGGVDPGTAQRAKAVGCRGVAMLGGLFTDVSVRESCRVAARILSL